MKGREKRVSFIVIILLLISGLIWGALRDNQNDYYEFPDMPKFNGVETTDLSEQAIRADASFEPNATSSAVGRTNYRNKTILVNENFTSNLPLIVIDTGVQEPSRGVVWDSTKNYYVSTGEDPYAYGKISIIDNKDGVNSPSGTAVVQSALKLKVRGNSSGNYDKQQYLLKLLDEEGKSQSKNILGMGSDNEWILNVSFIDKSLLRNFLAYTATGKVMPYTPDARFCEVLWKDGDQYCYEGVYLMMESVKVGKHRVDLPKYSENNPIIPTLLRRDRYNPNGIMLENYGTENGLTPGYLDIEYPDQDTITKKGIDNIKEAVSRFERVLYADSWKDFVQYREFVNMDSFVDYFIFNEFFLNYDAGYNSTYFYIDYSGKLSMGPVWDFDQAMDNIASDITTPYTTAFHAAPWFDRMLQDPVFTDCIIHRYEELRESILSDASIEDFVYSVVDYLGPAIERDWARWGYYYIDGNYLKTKTAEGKDRNTRTHTEEVEKILKLLTEHGAWLDENMDSLYQFKKISLESAQGQMVEKPNYYRQALAVIFIGIFLISIKLVLRYENE